MKTSDLIDAALDWAVVRANYEINYEEVWRNFRSECEYSTDWAQGGPIIEREGMGIRVSDGKWIAEWWADNSGMAKNPKQRFQHNQHASGPTPLIAAMRCYVASQLGDEVDIPAELMEAA